MADVSTTRLKITKPDVGGSDDTWGSKLNTDMDIVDRVYRDLTGELVSTSGTGTAHDVVLTHNDYADIDSTLGFRLLIRSGFTNIGPMSLNVGDGNGARVVHKFVDGVQTELVAGDFPIHYVGDFSYIRRSGFSGWILLNPAKGTISPPVLAGIPDASTVAKGIVELATNAEANSGTSAPLAVTPESLVYTLGQRVPSASTAVRGIVEIATSAEASSGTSAPLAVNPEGLLYTLSQHTATASTVGTIMLATSAEALTGTNTNQAITPHTLDYVFEERVGTTTKRGSTAFATGAESIAGAITNKAVQPAGLQNALDAHGLRMETLMDERITAALKQHRLIPE